MRIPAALLLAIPSVVAFAAKPVITKVEPETGTPGTLVTLTGTGLKAIRGVVVANQVVKTFESQSDDRLTFRVPGNATGRPIKASLLCTSLEGLVQTGIKFTTLPLETKAAGAAVERKSTRMDLFLPVITRVDPPAAAAGERIVLQGRNLRLVREVRIGAESLDFMNFQAIDDATLVFYAPEAHPKAPVKTTVVLQGPAGKAESPFTLLAESRPAATGEDLPVVTGIDPLVGHYGERVTLVGKGLSRVTRLRLAGSEARFFHAIDDTRLVCTVPEIDGRYLPLRAPWSLFCPGAQEGKTLGWVQSEQSFQIRSMIFSVTPDRAPAGATLLIRGWGLGTPKVPTSVTINGGTTAKFLKQKPEELWLQVPAEAGTGSAGLIVTVDGVATSPFPFRVTAARPAKVRIAHGYVTQAVQRLNGSVPLVAGREALLRVFVLAKEGNRDTPAVRATLRDAKGEVVATQDIPAPIAGVPTQVDEDHLETSWNLPVPGELVQPGLTVSVALLAEKGGEPLAGGRTFKVDVREVPPIAITLIPVRWGGAVGHVDGEDRTPEKWGEFLRQMYPLSKVDIQVGPGFDATTLQPEPWEGPDGFPFAAIRDALETRRLWEDPGNLRYFYGVARIPRKDTTLALGGSGGPGNLNRTAVGWDTIRLDSMSHYGATFIHEMGHCFGRDHTPAGNPAGVDPHYLPKDGTLDASGVRIFRGRPFPMPQRECTDVMGYGPHGAQWISAYTWEGVMAHLRKDPFADPASALEGKRSGAAGLETKRPVQASRTLMFHGFLAGEHAYWQPALELPGAPPPLPKAGPYRLRCLDQAHHPLLEVPFGAPVVHEEDGSERPQEFRLLLPLTPELEARLFTVEIHRGKHKLAILQAWGRGGPLEPRQDPKREESKRDPVEALRFRAGTVALRWEPREHPLILVRDPRNGAIIAQLQGGSGEVETDAAELEAIRTDGWRTDRIRVKVR